MSTSRTLELLRMNELAEASGEVELLRNMNHALKRELEGKCNIFHLAIPGGDLSKTLPFYTTILGCQLGPSEAGRWQDVNFWGNELTLHETTPRTGKGPDRERHEVDMGKVCVPHFGIHLSRLDFDRVRRNVENTVGFLDEPYVRFEGQATEQTTFFVEDPNFNVLEIKTMEGV